jgi:hypothetical protein
VRLSEWSTSCDASPASSDGPLLRVVGAAVRVKCRMPAAGSPILYETADPGDIAELAAALNTEDEARGYCMCIGTLVFELEAALLRAITLHHGVSVRWDGSRGNFTLYSPDALMDWLSARGMTFVRAEYEANRRQTQQVSTQSARWRFALPRSLAPFFDDMRFTGEESDPAWTAALEGQYPDPVERAQVLLDLYGHSSGPWTGFPIWEAVAERFLLGLPLEALLAAIGETPGVRRCEGAARLFSGPRFAKERPGERARIPVELRRTLLHHVETSLDPDKTVRARAALLEEPEAAAPTARGSTPGLMP